MSTRQEEIDLTLAVLCVLARGRCLTIYDIAQCTGLSQERVRKLQEHALCKIRRNFAGTLRELCPEASDRLLTPKLDDEVCARKQYVADV